MYSKVLIQIPFRCVVFVVVAIERMKYIARRWTDKRMTAKVIFSNAPKRSQSATNNNWATFARMENFQLMNSPPSRDRPDNRPGYQLPSPSHLMKQAPLSLESLPCQKASNAKMPMSCSDTSSLKLQCHVRYIDPQQMLKYFLKIASKSFLFAS